MAFYTPIDMTSGSEFIDLMIRNLMCQSIMHGDYGMSIKQFAADLRETMTKLRADGIETIKTENLIAYLDNVINSRYPEIDQAYLEKYRAELQLWLEQNKRVHVMDVEGFKSVIAAGQSALKTAFLMNGGATVALLAFIGKLSEDHANKIAEFSLAMIYFVMGVLLVTMSSGSTYLSQWFYFSPKTWQKKTGFMFNMTAIIFRLLSYILFIVGVFKAYYAFVTFV